MAQELRPHPKSSSVTFYVPDPNSVYIRKNHGAASIQSYRRTFVSSLLARGMDAYEIHDELKKQGILNHRTKKPFGVQAIIGDIEVIRKNWYVRSIAPTLEMKAEQLGRLRQVQREAWAAGKYPAVIQAMKLEMELTGTLKPVSIEFHFDMELILQLNKIIEVAGLNGDQLLQVLIDQVKTKVPQIAGIVG